VLIRTAISNRDVVKSLIFKASDRRKKIKRYLFAWDWWFLLFGLATIISLFIAKYPVESVKHILFLMNAALVYIVVRMVVKTGDQVKSLMLAVIVSLGIIVLLGYMQLIATFFAAQYYFWQYWATMISAVFYGPSLANVLIYSNSWFSYTGGAPSLRMFSIMPDSHSFAMVAAFLIAFLLAFTYRKKTTDDSSVQKLEHYGLWSMIRFSGFAVVLAGTRGVWVGMLAPLVLGIFFYFKKVARPLMKRLTVALLMIVLLFALSPFINQGLNLIRAGGKFQEDFLDRAASIYDLQEQSNVGRLQIWEESAVYALRHPLGIGYGNFIVSLVQDIPDGTPFEKVGEIKNTRYNLPQKFVTAHSLYLHVLVELGLVGLVALAGAIISYVYKIYQFLLAYQDDRNLYSYFVITFGFVMVWFFAYSVFDGTLFNDRILLYSFTGLALSAVIIERYESLRN
jgi:O-antigen ligase